MKYKWFKKRHYKHFDMPVNEAYAKNVYNKDYIIKHSWLPLIHYTKTVKRYKSIIHKTQKKSRDIMYASHRDACILSKYSSDINLALENYYKKNNIYSNVIAYRKLGRANYDFAADIYNYIISKPNVIVMCFDITGFFDNLNHSILKNRLKKLLCVSSLSEDWFKIFKQITNFHYVELDEIKNNENFNLRIKNPSKKIIATISEIKKASISIKHNSKNSGIPQGTPISAALSNVYMIDFDLEMAHYCNSINGIYRRYSDDILVIVEPQYEDLLSKNLELLVENHKLKINENKTEKVIINFDSKEEFQYLGFKISKNGAFIRQSSISKQSRKLNRAINNFKKISILKRGKNIISTKKLRKKFSPIGSRNFSKYARNAAKAFKSHIIKRQALKLERRFDLRIKEIKNSVI